MTGNLLDIAPGYMAYSLGTAMFLILAIAIVAEGFILYFLSYKSMKGSMLDSLAINLGSGLVGLVLGAMEIFESMDLEPIWIFILLFLLTVLIEGLLLSVLRKKTTSFKTVWISAVVVNFATYSMFAGFLLLENAFF